MFATKAATGSLAALVLLFSTSAAALAEGASWLDGPPKGWNTPGQLSPPRAPAELNDDPRCKARERGPSSAQESRVASAGWKLEDYWPAMGSGHVQLVTALADYDGMCRPMELNVFVFSNGAYAGTLSPTPMSSRADGVLAGPPGSSVVVAPDGTIRASFIRYAPNDPLCCPSGGRTEVTYRVQRVNDSSVVVPVRIAAATTTAAGVPTAAPRAGGGAWRSGTAWSLAGIAGLATGAGFGLLLRRGRVPARQGSVPPSWERGRLARPVARRRRPMPSDLHKAGKMPALPGMGEASRGRARSRAKEKAPFYGEGVAS